MNTEQLSDRISPNTRSPFISDGSARIKLSDFSTKQGKPIPLTNDERKALLTLFNPKKKLTNSWITIAVGVCLAVFGAVIGMILCSNQPVSLGIVGACFAVPGLLVRHTEFTVPQPLPIFRIAG